MSFVLEAYPTFSGFYHCAVARPHWTQGPLPYGWHILGHENISTALKLIQEEQLSFNGERMHTKKW